VTPSASAILCSDPSDGGDLAVLELGDETRREAGLRGETADGEAAFGPQSADVLADDVGIDSGAHVDSTTSARLRLPTSNNVLKRGASKGPIDNRSVTLNFYVSIAYH